ncbi:MAG: tandem-95 repeat protein, partial [Candidatus Thorarchaeota archaeon]
MTDWHGIVTFEYWVSDGALPSNTAIVTITVNSINDAPVATEDWYEIEEDGTILFSSQNLLDNDYDVDGDSFFVDDWSHAMSGYLMVYPGGEFEYIPDPDWHGTDYFEYWIYDGYEHSDVVMVTIVVRSVPDAPVAVDDDYVMDEDEILTIPAPGFFVNDYDADGDSLILGD